MPRNCDTQGLERFAGIAVALQRLWGKSSPRPEPSGRDAAALDSSVMGTDTRHLRQTVEVDRCIAANRLAFYVSEELAGIIESRGEF